jgi:hypothetical protein
MLASSIGWILIISGIGTAAFGLGALSLPRTTLHLMFGVKSVDGVTMFFVRHWGALLFVVCALTVYSAYVPVSRVPILTAAIIEKLAIVALIFFGPFKRTLTITVIGIVDGVLAILFIAYLAGVPAL